jgi:hypothetical protein
MGYSHLNRCRLSGQVSLTLKPAALTEELELLKDRVAFADDSGLAPPSLFCHGARHLDGLEIGKEVGEIVVEGWRREVRVGDAIWPARTTYLIKFN